MRITSIIFTFFILFTGNLQPISAQRSIKKDGQRLFTAGRYKDAISTYNKYKKIDKDPQLLINRGICYLQTRQPDACIADMAAAHNLKALNNKLFLYMAQAYESKGAYVEAAKIYKVYLNKLNVRSDEWYKIIHKIKQCAYALDMSFIPQKGYVENLGNDINTIYDDFSPVQSPTDQERFYFSSARETSTGGLMDPEGLEDNISGKYYADMYKVDLRNGKWSSVLPFEQVLNSTQHDIIQDFSSDGMTMYFVKSPDQKTGIALKDTFNFNRDHLSVPALAPLPFKPELGDRDLFVFSDSLILFSSMAFNGYGGYDLYYSIKHVDQWLIPINLGPKVNSRFNEIGPYLTKNGVKLFYSSDRIESLGGYDLFESSYDGTSNSWNDFVNLGLPINSTTDDTDIELASDGLNAIFTSDRVGSLGGKDLYIAYFKEQIFDQLDFIDVPLFVTPVNDSIIIDTFVKDTITLYVQEKPAISNEVKILPLKEVVTSPLFFKDNDDVLNNTNQINVKNIGDLMTIYPEIKVVLTSHFTPDSRADYDLYFSIKRAEKISSLLVSQGIKPERIFLMGCGPNYPIALHYGDDGQVSTLAAKTNRRIDIRFINVEPNLNLRLIPETPMVVDKFRDEKWDIFDINNQGVSFRVKFGAVNQMLKSELLSIRKDAIIQKNESVPNEYIYTFGNESTYAAARDIKTDLVKSQGRQDFIVMPYLFGAPMTREQITKLSPDYSELEIYLKQE